MFAFMPPEELSAEIEAIMYDFASTYQCKAALKPPVHITCYPPFTETVNLWERIKGLQEWASMQLPVEAILNSFAWFKNASAPIFYIAVVDIKELTNLYTDFWKQLKTYLLNVTIRPGYKPHITIGYRDISPEIVPQIKVDYATPTFEGSFSIGTLYLWEHDGKKWNVTDEYFLNGAKKF